MLKWRYCFFLEILETAHLFWSSARGPNFLEGRGWNFSAVACRAKTNENCTLGIHIQTRRLMDESVSSGLKSQKNYECGMKAVIGLFQFISKLALTSFVFCCSFNWISYSWPTFDWKADLFLYFQLHYPDTVLFQVGSLDTNLICTQGKFHFNFANSFGYKANALTLLSTANNVVSNVKYYKD